MSAGQVVPGLRERPLGFVIAFLLESGEGLAVAAGKRVELREGALVLIPLGEVQEIRNSGRAPLQMLKVDVPPADTGEGDELLPGGYQMTPLEGIATPQPVKPSLTPLLSGPPSR